MAFRSGTPCWRARKAIFRVVGACLCSALILAFLAVFGALMIFWAFMPDNWRKDCERTLISSEKSPDGAWIAETSDNLCDSGPMDTAIVTGVNLRSSVDGSEFDLLGKETNGHAEERPSVRWLTSHELEIILPDDFYVKQLRQSVRDVTITVRTEHR